ncbi:MAG TPA: YggT family protein [Thermoanaerobaculia bacterium]|nr:YggT family protein [Thermoanaerobaculia bacterium]
MEFVIILLRALDIILDVLQWVILVWVILSWVLFFLRESKFRWRHRQFYGTLEMLNDIFERMTRPFLRPIRRWMRRFDTAGIDWSPMVLVLIIWIVRQMLRALMIRLAGGLILSQ